MTAEKEMQGNAIKRFLEVVHSVDRSWLLFARLSAAVA